MYYFLQLKEDPLTVSYKINISLPNDPAVPLLEK